MKFQVKAKKKRKKFCKSHQIIDSQLFNSASVCVCVCLIDGLLCLFRRWEGQAGHWHWPFTRESNPCSHNKRSLAGSKRTPSVYVLCANACVNVLVWSVNCFVWFDLYGSHEMTNKQLAGTWPFTSGKREWLGPKGSVFQCNQQLSRNETLLQLINDYNYIWSRRSVLNAVECRVVSVLN